MNIFHVFKLNCTNDIKSRNASQIFFHETQVCFLKRMEYRIFLDSQHPQWENSRVTLKHPRPDFKKKVYSKNIWMWHWIARKGRN